MGSEHYCLRWNNHQSNLLGVFSQLLQDESLVDVTLACSEGASIRAHKVVLSACSSYFQSLFLDHPSRHPIVILKDVRFSELQTLVEFMYKGEVNVQYCQLSALLKTAESLKVKGLAEMTNQNTTLREPEREPDRLRPHSQPKPSTGEIPLEISGTPTPLTTQSLSPSSLSAPASATPSASGSITLNTNLGLKRENERCSPSSPKRLQHSSPTPLDLYHRKCPSSSNRDRDQLETARTPTLDDQPSPSDRHNSNSDDDAMSNDVGINMTINASTTNLSSSGGGTGSSGPGSSSVTIGGSGGVGVGVGAGSLGNLVNIGTGSGGSGSICGIGSAASGAVSASSSIQSIPQSVVVPPINSSNATSMQTDVIRPASRGCGPSSTITHTATSSGISSPIISAPVAGPSGLGPVQSVPLSLKKEIDWDRNDDKSSGDTLDYRHAHDSETSESPHGMGGVSSGPSLDQGGHVFPCMYCGATFPHQSKLTRHILSHSLESLKFRDTIHLLHPSQMASLLPHEMAPLPQQFSHRQAPPSLEPLEPPDGGPMDLDFVTAAAAASSAGLGGNSAISLAGGVGCPTGDPNSVVLCKFCGKSFPDVASLITHLPVHTGDRPFKCEFCGKAFKLRHHMKDHCRVHTGERPFRCSMCGKTFSRSTILKAHEKTHFPKYVRKFLSPSPVDTKDELPQADDHTMPSYSGSLTPHPTSGRCQTSFPFPFSPLGLNLFDTDPSRILSILHHQTLLAEEALRYRGILYSPKDPLRYNALTDVLAKEHELLFKRSALYKQSQRYPPINNYPPELPNGGQYQKDKLVEELKKKSEETVQKEEEELDYNENGSSSKESLSEFIRRRSESGSIRYNPLSSTETSSSCREKSSSSSTSSTPPPMIKPVSDAILFSEPIEEETRCVVCNANFPNVWLLEQHAALQHANLGPNDEKPFICEQCGQSYRYRSAYAKHKEQNHRARLPADKLFTCDVCGMQFRYLKSFKKHRLNHALERLHGKRERRNVEPNAQDVVTSSNETLVDDTSELALNIKKENEDEDQDNTVDSAGGSLYSDHHASTSETKISSSEAIYSTNKRTRTPSTMEPESSNPTTSINTLINAERIPSDQLLGLNPQEASILNFLRVDAAERQRDKRPPASRFACPFCGKCVRSKENLKLHVRKHTGERPFVCLFCGRAFGGKSDLTRHLRIHTGERPYHCESCGKCFARADYLSKHLTTHIHNAPR